MNDALAVTSLLLILAAYAPYIYSVVKRKTKPQRISWLLWMMLNATYFASAVNSDGAVLYTLGAVIGTATIFTLSIKYGTGGKSRFDITALFVALIAFGLLFVANQVLLALALALIVDGIGLMLTIQKLMRDRASESRLPWSLWFVASVIAIVALQKYSLESLLFPAYMIVSSGMVLLIINPSAKQKPIVK
ncbi:hypothetical protein FWG95_00970 [Candidatus Saccharibacteria bacterium]|nr:hypothetical protein [Candidatus Saccharibacteria bacterium]